MGGIFGGGSSPGYDVLELATVLGEEYTILAAHTLSAPLIIKRWTITHAEPELALIPRIYSCLSASSLRSTGAGFAGAAFARSINGGTSWTVIHDTAESSPTYVKFMQSAANTSEATNVTDLAVIGYNTNGTTTGKTKDISALAQLRLPVGVTVAVA